ncbi:MAG TPA: iron ABC transporter permease [Chthoniobacteraceae bacterium]|nr:iron ABC transporter permease [Chthoniobacteraceae bacterium]
MGSKIIVIVASAVLGVFLLWPVVESVKGAFVDAAGKFSLAFLAEVFRNPIYLEGLWNAVLMGIGGTAVALVIALPLAWVANRYQFPLKGTLTGVVLAPMVLPPFVGAIGLRAIFGQMGAVNAVLHHVGLLAQAGTIDWLGRGRFAGIVLLNGLHLYPILYLNAAAALANIDPALEEAAENLGCTGWRKFCRVTLPLMMPGIFAGGSIVFIWAFTELGTPLMFNFSRILPVQIFNGMKELAGNGMPFALVVVMLVAAIGLYGLTRLALGRAPVAMAGRATVGRVARRAGGVKGVLCALLFAGVAAVALLPHLAVVLLSFARDWYGTVLPVEWTLGHYREALGHSMTVPSIGNSLRYSGLATVLDVALGIGIAWVLTRRRAEMPAGAAVLDGLSMLPLAVPGLVLAFGYIALSQPGRPLAALNPGLHSPALLLVAAYGIRRLPYMVRSVVAGLQQTSVTLEEAAQSVGATPFRTLRRITLPLVSGNILAGMLLAFAFSMLEVSDSLVLAQRVPDYPITKAIYELYNLLGDGRFLACALGVWAMVFLALTIGAASRILGTRMGALFRI